MKNKMTKIMISNVITLILVIQKFLILRYERERTQKIRLVIEKIFSLKPTILKSQVKTKPVTQLITNNKKKSEMKRTGN